MTSGRILGILCRAHELTNDEKYLDFARSVFEKFSQPLNKGGMISYIGEEAWIEEVAYPSLPSYKVLNGHIFGLSGLQTYARYTGNKKAKKLVDRAIFAVSNSLSTIDSGFLSYYSENVPVGREKFFAERRGYNTIHVSQLLWLYSLTDNAEFLKYAMRFQAYDIFEPKVTASFSTNLVTHGPERMNLKFGTNYWSSYKFPVEVQFSFDKAKLIEGVMVIGHTPKSTPRDFSLSVYNGSTWEKTTEVFDNSDQRLSINFNQEVPSSAIRLNIATDNGNGAVALDGVGIIIKDNYYPIVNFENYTTSSYILFDSEVLNSFPIKSSGFVVLPAVKEIRGISVRGDVRNDAMVKIYGSNAMDDWHDFNFEFEKKPQGVDYTFSGDRFRFYRMEFSESFAISLSEIGFLY